MSSIFIAIWYASGDCCIRDIRVHKIGHDSIYLVIVFLFCNCISIRGNYT